MTLAHPKPKPRKKQKRQADAIKQTARKQFAMAVMDRDGHRCLACGKTPPETPLTVHEWRKRSQHNYNWSEDEMQWAGTLCLICHIKAERGFYGPEGKVTAVDFQISVIRGLRAATGRDHFLLALRYLTRLKERQNWREAALRASRGETVNDR